jgi:hypothetical protein
LSVAQKPFVQGRRPLEKAAMGGRVVGHLAEGVADGEEGARVGPRGLRRRLQTIPVRILSSFRENVVQSL